MFRKINRSAFETRKDGTEERTPLQRIFDLYSREANLGFERCIEMKLPDKEGADKEGLEEFVAKLKACVGNSLGRQISFYQAEVDKLYESREIPGWNYCSFFAIKVSSP